MRTFSPECLALQKFAKRQLTKLFVSWPPVTPGRRSLWSADPVADVRRMLAELPFAPTWMRITVHNDIECAGKVLGLEVPQATGSRKGLGDGTISLASGATVRFAWHSYDGRAIDALMLGAPYQEDLVLELVREMSQAIGNIETMTDLHVTVGADASELEDQDLYRKAASRLAEKTRAVQVDIDDL